MGFNSAESLVTTTMPSSTSFGEATPGLRVDAVQSGGIATWHAPRWSFMIFHPAGGVCAAAEAQHTIAKAESNASLSGTARAGQFRRANAS